MWYPGLDSTRVLRDQLQTWLVVMAFSMIIILGALCLEKQIPKKFLYIFAFILGYIYTIREEALTIIPILAFPFFIICG